MSTQHGGGRSGGASRLQACLRARLRYRLEHRLSSSLGPILLSLACLPLLFGTVAGVVLTMTHTPVEGAAGVGFVEAVWMSLLRTLDPGTMGSDAGWPLRIVSLLVTLSGIVVVTVLIGLVDNAISGRIEHIRKGRSAVVESGHTLVLGWSPTIFAVLDEIVTANANHRGRCIVVMAPRDKVTMEDEIRARVRAASGTRIVCRTGDPAHLDDLDIVRPDAARSIVLLAPSDDGDAQVIRTAIAIAHRWPDAPGAIVAELADLRNARALREATEDRVVAVASAHVIGQITAQVCRQAGLGIVYQELLDFAGDEIVFADVPELEGHTFGDALLGFDTSAVIGIRRVGGTIELNPPMDATFGRGDRVIAISEDDDTVVPVLPLATATVVGGRSPQPPETPRERILFVGWNHLGPLILHELDDHVGAGSIVDVIVDPELIEPRDHPQDGRRAELRHLEVRVHQGDARDAGALEERLMAEHYERIVVLCYHGLPAAEADALSLLSLVQIQQLRRRIPTLRDGATTTVVHLLDQSDVELARLTGADDFIVSDRLTSLMLAQLSENPELRLVFQELFDAEGSVISCRPAHLYLDGPSSGTWRDVVAAGARRGEVAIGYRTRADIDAPPIVHLNPRKSGVVELQDGDEVVVIANRPRPGASTSAPPAVTHATVS